MSAALPGLCLGLAGLAALALLALAPRPGAPVALLFPPWVSAEAARAAALSLPATLIDSRAGGRLLLLMPERPGAGLPALPGALRLAARAGSCSPKDAP